MEQHPHHEQHTAVELVTDVDRIHHGITEALREDRPVDNATARAIASQLHGGQDSPLYAFSWADAATWSRKGMREAEATDDLVQRFYDVDRLDELFDSPPTEQLGSVDELGWFALLDHPDRPGGLILQQSTQGFRYVQEALTDDALTEAWESIRQQCEDFQAERDAYELATDEAGDSPSGYNPRIWVGSLADNNDGRLHGVWLDATLSPEELTAAARFMLRNGYTPGAEEWGIFDSDEFAGYEVGEYASFELVSLVARGVAQYGEAYAKWVEHVGEQSIELLHEERFRDHYHGTCDSVEAYVEEYLTESDAYAFMQFMPEHLQAYVRVDVAQYAEAMQSEGLVVEELSGGRVAVFWVR